MCIYFNINIQMFFNLINFFNLSKNIRCVITTLGSGLRGDLVFSARNTTVNTDVAVERMRITSSGIVCIRSNTPNTGATLDVGGTSASTYYTYLNGLRLSERNISIHHNVPNNDMTFHTNWS